MVEPFSPFTKVVVRPCCDCKRDVAVLVGSRVLRGEIVSTRCPDCWEAFRKKYPTIPDAEEAKALNDLVTGVLEGRKPGDVE